MDKPKPLSLRQMLWALVVALLISLFIGVQIVAQKVNKETAKPVPIITTLAEPEP